jgi:hypothetical protein
MPLISQKCLPALRRRLWRSHHVFRDRRLGNFEPEHRKRAMDPGCTPQRVFLAHSSDEIAQLAIDLRPPCPISRLPTPEHLEARAMSPQDGLGLNNLRRAKKVWPEPGHPYEQRAITTKKSKTGWYPPQEAPADDIWMRDIAPTFAACGDKVVAIDWNFNGWGDTKERPSRCYQSPRQGRFSSRRCTRRTPRKGTGA